MTEICNTDLNFDGAIRIVRAAQYRGTVKLNCEDASGTRFLVTFSEAASHTERISLNGYLIRERCALEILLLSRLEEARILLSRSDSELIARKIAYIRSDEYLSNNAAGRNNNNSIQNSIDRLIHPDDRSNRE